MDDEFVHRAKDNFGAFILGRNMFGSVRGPCRTAPGEAGGATILLRTFVLTHHEHWQERCYLGCV